MDKKRKKSVIKNVKNYQPFLSDNEYQQVLDLFEHMITEIPVSKENYSHCYQRIFPLIAVYQVMKQKENNALERVTEAFNEVVVYPGARSLKKLFKFPFIHKFIPKIIPKLLKKSYQESSDGFQIEFLEKNKNVCRFHIKQCTYYNYCVKLDVPELCNIFCQSDEISGKAMEPNIVFERESTIARGAAHCDFCYRLKEKS